MSGPIFSIIGSTLTFLTAAEDDRLVSAWAGACDMRKNSEQPGADLDEDDQEQYTDNIMFYLMYRKISARTINAYHTHPDCQIRFNNAVKVMTKTLAVARKFWENRNFTPEVGLVEKLRQYQPTFLHRRIQAHQPSRSSLKTKQKEPLKCANEEKLAPLYKGQSAMGIRNEFQMQVALMTPAAESAATKPHTLVAELSYEWASHLLGSFTVKELRDRIMLQLAEKTMEPAPYTSPIYGFLGRKAHLLEQRPGSPIPKHLYMLIATDLNLAAWIKIVDRLEIEDAVLLGYDVTARAH